MGMGLCCKVVKSSYAKMYAFAKWYNTFWQKHFYMKIR